MSKATPKKLSLFRLVIARGCLQFAPLFLMLQLGSMLYSRHEMTFTFVSYCRLATIAVVSGAIWGLLMWVAFKAILTYQQRRKGL